MALCCLAIMRLDCCCWPERRRVNKGMGKQWQEVEGGIEKEKLDGQC